MNLRKSMAVSLGALVAGAVLGGCGSAAHPRATAARSTPSDHFRGTFVLVSQYGGPPGSRQGSQPGRMVHISTANGVLSVRTGANGEAAFPSVGKGQTRRVWVDGNTCSDGVLHPDPFFPFENDYTIRCDVK